MLSALLRLSNGTCSSSPWGALWCPPEHGASTEHFQQVCGGLSHRHWPSPITAPLGCSCSLWPPSATWYPWSTPFWTEVSIYLFCKKFSVKHCATTLTKIFTSVLSKNIILNWLMFSEFSSFGFHTPFVYLHCLGTFLQMTLKMLHSRRRSRGQCL